MGIGKMAAARKLVLTLSLLVLIPSATFAAPPPPPSPTAPGISNEDVHSVQNQTEYYGTNDSCSPSAGDPAASGSPTSDTLDGHQLPATVGGTGDEDPVDATGHLTTTGGAVTFSQYASLGQAYQDYYITMRWRYAKWNWDGTSVPGPEDSSWYGGSPKPRLVLVTNPRTKKSIIADIMESGPAPWTGTSTGQGAAPSYWHDPQDGTPSQYDGRVSGFPPPAIQALGADQTVNGSGDKLEYAWAPDQNAKPGPTDAVAGSGGSAGCASAGTTGDGSNSAIVQVAQQELALGLVGTGPLSNSGAVCKYQGSACGEAWCADFVSWVYKTAGKPFTGGSPDPWRLSLASDITGYFLDKKGQPGIGYGSSSGGGDKMEPGWAVTFSGSQAGARGIGHVGIVVDVNSDGSFDTIEGNAGPTVTKNHYSSPSSAIDWGGYK